MAISRYVQSAVGLAAESAERPINGHVCARSTQLVGARRRHSSALMRALKMELVSAFFYAHPKSGRARLVTWPAVTSLPLVFYSSCDQRDSTRSHELAVPLRFA